MSASTSSGNSTSNSPWRNGYIPNLPVISQDGQTYKLYDDLIKGKIVVINYIFTGCSQLCPLTTARLAAVQADLGEAMGRDIFFLSISLDPVNDTPDKLKKFADGYKVGPGWFFLTGNPDDLKLIRERLGERSQNITQHQAVLILTNDKTGEWGKDSAMSEISHLVETIRDLDPEWHNRPRDLVNQVPGDRAIPLSNVQGQALFARACASCHTIGRGDKVGPDLAGVTARRDRDWLTKFIVRPDKMRQARDPLALELYEKYNRVAMPFLGLSDADASDLLAYIEATPAKPKAAQMELQPR